MTFKLSQQHFLISQVLQLAASGLLITCNRPKVFGLSVTRIVLMLNNLPQILIFLIIVIITVICPCPSRLFGFVLLVYVCVCVCVCVVCFILLARRCVGESGAIVRHHLVESRTSRGVRGVAMRGACGDSR